MAIKKAAFDELEEQTRPVLSTEASTALVPVEDEEAPVARITYTDDPEFDRDEVLVPRLSLTQGLSTAVTEGSARPGQWFVPGYEAESEVVFLPLQFGRSRECRVGVPQGQYSNKPCPDGCPGAEWTKDPETGRNRRPVCVQKYHYVGWSVTHQSLVSVTFQKTSEKAAKLINTMIQAARMRHGRSWPGAFAVKFGVKQEQSAAGSKFFAPTVAPVKVGEEDVEIARTVAGSLRGDS